MLGRAGNESGPQSAAPRRREIGIMCGREADLRGLEHQRVGRAQIGFGRWLVGLCDFGTEDRIPGQPGSFGHVDHQANIAVGKRGNDEAPLEPREPLARNRARDPAGVMPDQPVQFVCGHRGRVQAKVRQDGEGIRGEGIERRICVFPNGSLPWRGNRAAAMHRRTRKHRPRLHGGLKGSGLPSDAAAPVNDRAENVEDQRLNIVHHLLLITRGWKAPYASMSHAFGAKVGSDS